MATRSTTVAEHAVTLVAGAGLTSPEAIDEQRARLLACLDAVHPLPPLGFIVDLGRLLLGHAPKPRGDDGTTAIADRRLRHALAEHAEHVVGRLRNDPRLMPASDAMAAMPSAQHPRAIAALCSAIMLRIGDGLPAPRVAALRRLVLLPSAEIIALAADGLGDPATAERAAEAYEHLTRNARRVGVLLHSSDVFMLENLEGLPTAADRLAFMQTGDAAELLEAPLPKRARRRRTRAGDSPSALEDESTYPTGGFASISTSGSLENLVTSELAYLGHGREVDLFDVRYVTGELLKYTRDESVFARLRRTMVFWLAPELAHARVKDVSAPWQRLVLATGLVVAAARRLFRWLDDIDLEIDLRIPDALVAEGHLVAMLLREWVESGHVVFGQHGPRATIESELAARRDRHDVDLIVIGYSTTAGFPVTLACGQPVPSRTIVPSEAFADCRSAAAWQSAVERLLFELV